MVSTLPSTLVPSPTSPDLPAALHPHTGVSRSPSSHTDQLPSFHPLLASLTLEPLSSTSQLPHTMHSSRPLEERPMPRPVSQFSPLSQPPTLASLLDQQLTPLHQPSIWFPLLNTQTSVSHPASTMPGSTMVVALVRKMC